MSAISDYYRWLDRWTAVGRLVGYSGGRDTLTVHRALADPSAGGRPTRTRLHDLLMVAIGPLTRGGVPLRVLDAGCGYGGTMIDLCRRAGGTFVGVTLSERQAAIGRRAITRLGLSDVVRIDVRDYDTPPEGPFDLIVAIESLAHSQDPAASVAALGGVLSPQGRFVIVDDMPETDAAGDEDLSRFKAGWGCPILWEAHRYREAFGALGLQVDVDDDLTSACRPRSLTRLRQFERLNAVARSLVPSVAWRAVLDSYRGGLALERLCRRGRVRYRLMIGSRQGAQTRGL